MHPHQNFQGLPPTQPDRTSHKISFISSGHGLLILQHFLVVQLVQGGGGGVGLLRISSDGLIKGFFGLGGGGGWGYSGFQVPG